MPLEFEQQLTVQNFECDPFGRMAPGALLRRVQEISYAQCETLGLTAQHYAETCTVFLLSRMGLAIKGMPGVGQAVRLVTRAYGMKRAVFHRVTTLYTTGGEELCEVDTRWVLVDTNSRRILRTPPEGFRMPFLDTDIPAGQDVKLPKPDAAPVLLRETQAYYSLCDTNGHVNNTRYVDLVCNHLPLDRLREGPPRSILLSYHKEIPLGRPFAVSGGRAGEGYYFIANAGDDKNFEAFVTF